ncbi:3'(2'),5'-bisphosphate nucleotidase CysQ [Kordia jejudonensis]|uniref:3'(2'),5'-bisphosphate nucleotidase CysQ n=1 Tax=Kordia jejudonensis TaxID=1348245 RepID=UPI00062979C9|nr:3'(2'),5'-bisphosphate nucleotidase CysQ [Kordia jejudonensis]
MPNSIQSYLEKAIKSAVNAGSIIMDIYENENFAIEIKSDDSPVTIADKKANEYIEKALQSTNIPVISEEGDHTAYEIRKHWKQFWCVDPLDGTKEFIKRNGEFTVNIALIENEKPILGVIYIPVTKTVYFAITAEKKAFKLVLKEHVVATQLIDNAVEIFPETQSNIVKITSSRSYTNAQVFDLIARLEAQNKKVTLVKAGSSIKFCLIAEGKATSYPRYAPTMEWDTAAGQAICNAVGIEVYSLETDEPLQYNKKNLLNPWFIVRKIG